MEIHIYYGFNCLCKSLYQNNLHLNSVTSKNNNCLIQLEFTTTIYYLINYLNFYSSKYSYEHD